MSHFRVLVVDDHRSAAEAVAFLLRREGHEVQVCNDGGAAIRMLEQHPFDLVFTDLRMEPLDGLAVVRAARAQRPPVDAIVFTAYATVESAVDAMRQGAMDFLTKPVTADQLLRRIRDYRKAPPPARELLGHSAQAEQLRQLAAQAAQVRSTVMIIGETGTGRRHLARHLHERGPDAALPLLTLSPSAEIDPQAVEGAGALLIPSVDDWPPEALDRLQRALERLEAGQPPRVIATASPQVDLRAARGDLSPELYFRLAVLMVRIPPLRARPEDALVLLEHFLRSHAQLFNKPLPALAADQREALLRHSWPGNIREVANLAERAVVLGTAQLHVESRPTAPDSEALPPGFQLPEHLERIERELLERAIAQTGGDRPAISRLLGVERNTLRYKLNKYGLLDRTTT